MERGYVPKYLWRDELPFAKRMMGQSVQNKYQRTIIEWYIGLRNNWLVNTGANGRKFKQYLNPETWLEYESTFTGADIEENWQAFFNAVSLFGRLAGIVGRGLGYNYPADLEKEMTDFYIGIKRTKRNTDSNNHMD